MVGRAPSRRSRLPASLGADAGDGRHSDERDSATALGYSSLATTSAYLAKTAPAQATHLEQLPA